MWHSNMFYFEYAQLWMSPMVFSPIPTGLFTLYLRSWKEFKHAIPTLLSYICFMLQILVAFNFIIKKHLNAKF